MRLGKEHRLALFIAAGVLVLWLAGMAAALRVLAPPNEASGRLLAIFPPEYEERQAMEAIVRAGGRTFGQTWFLLGWAVLGEDPGFAGRLRAHGAFVLIDLPLVPTLAGCTGVAATANTGRRPTTN